MAESGKSEGVPRETKRHNTLEKLRCDLAPVLPGSEAKRLIDQLVAAGYFEKSLLEQKGAIVEKLAGLGKSPQAMDALLKSESDKIRSYAVSLSGLVLQKAHTRQLALLKKAGAMPGTWTQETAQTELKNLMHREGVAAILPQIECWATDKRPEVRRLMIEALRPRGVWCAHLDDLKRAPTPIKAALEQLLDDDSLYVRKAVANNLNDIAKDNPTLLRKWVKQWQRGKISAEREWIIKRGLRSLLKAGYPAALKLIGYGDARDFKFVWKPDTPKQIRIGDQIPFEFEVTNENKQPTKCRLQLEMHAPGKGNKPRVSRYLLADVELKGGESRSVSKRVKFEHRNSVPKLPGEYKLVISLNGEQIAERATRYSQ